MPLKAEVREYDRLFLDEAPDSHEDKSFMELINPDSLKIIKEAFVEPFLREAKAGDKFQFQRLGYFTLDTDSSADHLVFNKTVGLKDSWAKQQPAPTNQPTHSAQNQNPGQKSALNEIKKISKKYTNLSGDKLVAARQDIAKYAEDVSYEELEPLFGTAAKKVGTRIGVMIALGVLLKNGQEKNEHIDAFIAAGLEDGNEMLVEEAKTISI